MPQLPPRKRVAASVAAVATAAAVTPAILVASAHAAGSSPSFANMTTYVAGLPSPVALSGLTDGAKDAFAWSVDNAGCTLVNQPTQSSTPVGETFVSCATSVTGAVTVTATVTDSAAGAADAGTYQAKLTAAGANSVPTTLSMLAPATACAGVSSTVDAQLYALVNGKDVAVNGQKVTFTTKVSGSTKSATAVATTATVFGTGSGIAVGSLATPSSSVAVSAAFVKSGVYEASSAGSTSVAADAGGYFAACVPWVPASSLGILTEAGQSVSGSDLSAGVPYLVSGMAYRATSTSGYAQKTDDADFDDDWIGYAGLKVSIIDSVTTNGKTSVTTVGSGTVDAEGKFSILYKPAKAVSTGKLSLSIPASTATGPAISESLGNFDVKAVSTAVTASVASNSGVLTEGVPAIVSGTVTAGSASVPGVPVTAKMGSTVLGSGVTDASGHYNITVAPKTAVTTATAITVTSAATGGLAAASGTTDKVTVAPQGLALATAKSPVTVAPGTAYKLTDTLVRGAGTPVAKATVELTDAKGAVKVKATTAADGTFTLSYTFPASTASGTVFYVVLPTVSGAAVASPASASVAGSYLAITVQTASSAPSPSPSDSATTDPSTAPTTGAGDTSSSDAGDQSTAAGDPTTAAGDPTTAADDPTTAADDPTTAADDPTTGSADDGSGSADSGSGDAGDGSAS